MQTLKHTLTIDIWSDLVCPWCWIAKKRFEQGLNRFEFRDQVVIRHHSYRLAGGTPAMPFKDAIVKKLGSQHSAELMMDQVGTAGKSEGLIYNFDGMMFGDTEDAHTLLVAARKAGIADAVEGLSGVPVFVMNEKYAISGAQGADNFLNALRQVWDEQQTEFSATAGQTCGTDGCSI